MTFPIFLRWLISRVTAFLRILRYLVPAARLRFLLSLFTRRSQHRPRTSATEKAPESVIGSSTIDQSDPVNVCGSRLPSLSLSDSHISLDFIRLEEGYASIPLLGAGPQKSPLPVGVTGEISSTSRASLSPSNNLLSNAGSIQQTVSGQDTSQTSPVTSATEEQSLRLGQITPMALPIYFRRASNEYEKPPEFELLPYKTRTLLSSEESRTRPIGVQWEQFTHPQGFVYFRHCSKRTWTMENIRNPGIRRSVEACVDILDQRISSAGFPNDDFPGGCELVISVNDVDEEKGVFSGEYYCVHHASRSVFWLERMVLTGEDKLGHGVMRGSLSPGHTTHLIEEFYWRHIFIFPHLSQENYSEFLWDKLLDDITFNLQDCVIHPNSPCLYSQTQLEHMRYVARRACDRSRANAQLSSDLICMLAHAQMLMARQRFRNAHGQPHVRLLSTNRTFIGRFPDVLGDRNDSKFLVFCSFILLFGEPSAILQDLESVMVDGMILLDGWRWLLQRLYNQWNQFLLLNTVILAVNISFLAIPDSTGGDLTTTIISYVSILLSILGMATSLALTRHAPPDLEIHSRLMVAYHELTWVRPAILAVLYSIPSGLLTWSITLLLMAILLADFSPIPFSVLIIALILYVIISMGSLLSSHLAPSRSTSRTVPEPVLLNLARDTQMSPTGEDLPEEMNHRYSAIDNV